MAGRPRIMDVEMKIAAVKAVKSGLGRAETARLLGIDRKTLINECKQDADFSASLCAAESRGELLLIRTIMKARSKDWRAAAWFLERKYPERWSAKERRELAELTERLKQLENERRAANA